MKEDKLRRGRRGYGGGHVYHKRRGCGGNSGQSRSENLRVREGDWRWISLVEVESVVIMVLPYAGRIEEEVGERRPFISGM